MLTFKFNFVNKVITLIRKTDPRLSKCDYPLEMKILTMSLGFSTLVSFPVFSSRRVVT